jgi:hypothetical protein
VSKILQYDHIIRCEFPDSSQLQTAFLSLPDAGRVEVTCSIYDLTKISGELTRIGFFGLRILISDIAGPLARISAFKGKGGPCYDTGRAATYTGEAIAALDDDGHLLFGPTPVCEKTATIYKSKIYKDVVKVSEPEPVLFDKLKKTPEPFDCDNLEDNAQLLAKRLTLQTIPSESDHIIFYPGPFQLLILANGAIIKRGQAIYIAQTYIKKLQKSDNCLLFPAVKNIQPVSADYFQDVYREKGLIGVIDTGNATNTIRHSENINLRSLDITSESMRLRLQKVISNKENYFILTGSDPWDLYGCCPSKETGAANRLVESGILESWQASKHQDSCPITVYAFNREIKIKEGKPSFTENTLFREQVLKQLALGLSHWQKNTINILRLALLLFVLVSLIYAINKSPQIREDSTENSDDKFIENSDIVKVYIAHFGISCQVCENMKKLTQQAMNRYFKQYIDAEELIYQPLNIDDPRNASLVNYFNLYSNSVIFAHERHGKIVDHKIVKDRISILSHSDSEFIEMIREELILFMNKFK